MFLICMQRRVVLLHLHVLHLKRRLHASLQSVSSPCSVDDFACSSIVSLSCFVIIVTRGPAIFQPASHTHGIVFTLTRTRHHFLPHRGPVSDHTLDKLKTAVSTPLLRLRLLPRRNHFVQKSHLFWERLARPFPSAKNTTGRSHRAPLRLSSVLGKRIARPICLLLNPNSHRPNSANFQVFSQWSRCDCWLARSSEAGIFR